MFLCVCGVNNLRREGRRRVVRGASQEGRTPICTLWDRVSEQDREITGVDLRYQLSAKGVKGFPRQTEVSEETESVVSEVVGNVTRGKRPDGRDKLSLPSLSCSNWGMRVEDSCIVHKSVVKILLISSFFFSVRV